MIRLTKPDFDENEIESVKRVFDSGWIVQGREVAHFEEIIADYCGAENCVVVSSGHAALHLTYLLMGIGPGDAVFVPSFAWPSAANVAELLGARAVFVDVLPDTYNIDPNDLIKQIEICIAHDWGVPRLLVPVHEFGLMADMDSIMEIIKKYDLSIIEDAACALGASHNGKKVGSYSNMAILSFHPRKAITTGEGGAIITNDPEAAKKLRAWRNHGQLFDNGKRAFVLPGLNYRMTEFQAAIGRVQMAKFPSILERRKKIVMTYIENLQAVEGIRLPEWDHEHTWQTFMLVLEKHHRDHIVKRLQEKGIETGPGSVAGHMGKYFQDKYGYKDDDLMVSSLLHRNGLALPLYPKMNDSDVKKVLDELIQALR